MQVLCLDESGKCTNPNETNYIAGFCCSLEDDNEWYDFCEKLYDMLWKQCSAAGRNDFPECLHSTASWTDKSWRLKLRNITCRIYADFHEMLRPVCMLQYGGTTAFDFKSSMLSGLTASNLYNGMLSALLEGVLYHNPYIDATEAIKIELPTRQAMVQYPMNATPEMINELDKQAEYYTAFGHSCRSIDCGPEYSKVLMFNTVEPRGIYTMLQSYPQQQHIEVLGLTPDSIKIKSIHYHRSAPRTMAGMFLADLTCEWLKDYLFDHGLRTSAGSVKFLTISDEIQRDVNTRPLLFESTSTDTLYRTASTALRKNEMANVIDALYDLNRTNTSVSHYYISLLEPRISAKLFTDDTAISAEVSYLNAQYKAAQYTKVQWCGQFLYDHKMAVDGFDGCKAPGFALAELLMNCYNHCGNYEEASKYLKICEANMGSFRPGPEKWEFVNRTLSQLENVFAFDTALTTSNGLINSYERYREMVCELLQDSMNKSLQGMRLYGKRGQLHAYLNQCEEALLDLQRSLAFCPEDDTGNMHICLSYLLQYSLHFCNQPLYEMYERAYFHLPNNMTDRAAILEYEWNMLDQVHHHSNGQYALLIFVKALWRFYRHDVPNHIVEQLTAHDYSANSGYTVDVHPFELIYKYIAFIAADRIMPSRIVNRILMIIQGKFFSIQSDQMTTCLIARNGYLEYALQFAPSLVPAAYTMLQKAIGELGDKQPEIKLYFSDALKTGKFETITPMFTYLYD